MTISPLTEIREKYGITKQDLAIMLDISLPTEQRIEAGISKIPEKCHEGLKQLGLNPDEVLRHQEQFINEKKKAIVENIRQKKVKGK
jgi:hypothetical protein